MAVRQPAPVFRNIALDIIRYLDIAPSVQPDEDEKAGKLLTVPELTDKDIFEAENLLRKEGFDVKIVGKNNIVQRQVPLAGARVLEGTTILLFTEEDYAELSDCCPGPDWNDSR